MNWMKIKNSINQDLLSRGLSNPRIRLNALERIEGILKTHFPDYLKNPSEMFGKIEKNEFKKRYTDRKESRSMSDAESSVINEIYYRI